MTTIAVEYKEPIVTKRTVFYILLKYVLKLLEGYLVGCPAVLAYTNCLIRRYKPVFILSYLVYYRLKNNK